MLDKLEKTRQLMAALKEALPFEVEFTPEAVALTRSQGAAKAVEPRQIVSQVYYAGDEGGVVCALAPKETENVIMLSLQPMSGCIDEILLRLPYSTTRSIG